jgi:hypothetical protein
MINVDWCELCMYNLWKGPSLYALALHALDKEHKLHSRSVRTQQSPQESPGIPNFDLNFSL